MLTLSGTDLLAGVASVAAKLTTTLTGAELDADGNEVYKVLYQGQLPDAAATLYAPPTGSKALCKSLLIVNTDSTSRTFTLYLNGTGDANKIVGPITLPAGFATIWAADGWSVYNEQLQRLSVGATGATGASGGAADYAESADISTLAFGDTPAAGASVTEVAGANHRHGMPADPVTAHAAAADPHAVYQKESEKDANSGYAGLAASQGTRDGTKFLRDDGTWQAAAGGGGAPTGAAGGDLGGTYPNPSVNDNSHAHDTTTVTTHSTAHAHSSLTGLTSGDDHTQYQKESEKGAASGYAGLDAGTKVPTAQLGSGTADGATFLRGDQTYAVPAGGGGGLTDHTHEVTGSGATGGGATVRPATLILPGATTPAQTAEGSLVWDTDGEQITVGDGAGGRKIFLPFDSGTPTAQAFGDAAASGTTGVGPRLDHRHGMPANPVVGLVHGIEFLIDGGGAVIATGIKGDLTVEFACTITKWTLLADVSGSIVVDIWKAAYASFPPVIGNVITASAKPTISATTKGQSSTLTGWTTSIAAGDVLRFNVNSATTITRATLVLTVART